MINTISHRLLRLSIAFAFIYPAIAIHLNRENWIGYFPDFLLSAMPEDVLVIGFTAIHIIIAFWILFGERIKIPAIIASLLLLGIIAFNLNQMDVIFRDFSLLLVALALTMHE